MLTALQNLANGQGPLFWGSAAAAALGASLLVAALLMQARRWRLRIRFPRFGRFSFHRPRRHGATTTHGQGATARRGGAAAAPTRAPRRPRV